ncbi:TauD/TfdA family dioxygenase [Streptomyces crystallinus]|uniref:TauD/TfdA-like domain-containing protein n=1 Tax=Streptomyces crystallinus TaxID=68191 RepID=A0ABP3QAR0_9ACTN
MTDLGLPDSPAPSSVENGPPADPLTPRYRAAGEQHQGKVTIMDLPVDLANDLIKIGRALPAWDVEGAFLAYSTLEQYQAALDSTPLFNEFMGRLLAELYGMAGGYAVVRLDRIAQELGLSERFLRLATAVLTQVAIPFQPFQRWPLWKEIGTNLNANPGLSTGTGYNAFHMDLVNATRPPDYTVLLCVRPDPLGAGASILSDARAAVRRLTSSRRALLADVSYRYGGFFDLCEVGEEFTPFPVLDGKPEDSGFVRFTAKMLSEPNLGLDEEHAQAARELADQMVAGQVSYTLQRGDLLIVDQHRWVHGRRALGDGQERVAPENRRLLLQLFLRSVEPGDFLGPRARVAG